MALRNAILTGRPIAGHNTTISEHAGQGTQIDAADLAQRKKGKCFNIVFNPSTTNGHLTTASGGCVVIVSSTLSGAGTFCCNDGNPIPGCNSCTCVFNFISNTSPTFTGDICSACSGQVTAQATLQQSGSLWGLTLNGQALGNCTCGSSSCAFNSGLDASSPYSLGTNPVGTHTVDWTGHSGLVYHYVIVIS